MTSITVERRRLRARIAMLSFSTILCSGLAAPAFAQSAPPQHVDVDQNGVDLVSGNYVTSLTEGSIGSGEGAVSLTRFRNGSSNWIDNWTGGLLFQTSGTTTTAIVLVGAASEAFSVSGSTYTSLAGDGATLVANGSGYLFTSGDGTKIQFISLSDGYPVKGFACASYSSFSCSIPISITKPDGMTFSLNWTYVLKCNASPLCAAGIEYYRFAGVTSSAGYGFTVQYVTNSAGNFSAPQTDWYNKTSVTFGNANNPPASPPVVSYPTPSSDHPDFTDPAGRSWHFGAGIGVPLTSIQRPGASSASTIISYSGTPSYVSSITNNGVTTTYSRSVSGSPAIATTTITDALSNQTIVEADLTLGRVTKVTKVTKVMSPANLVTTYAYDGNSRLTDVTNPEGDIVHYAYDGRGNVTSTTRKAKPSSGLSDIVTSATYPSSCTADCNEPVTTTDALGNQTNYTYDPPTGLVTKVTAPAAITGAARPETRYSYTALSGVTMLTGVSTCQTGTAPTCVGTADEVATTVGYDTNYQPNSVSNGAGDGSLTATTTATYDGVGNPLTVDGPLSGTADTTTFRYDAARQRVGEISPDPDGAGAMKRRAIRTTYNNDGQVTEAEAGTVNGTTDTDWAAFVSLQQSTQTYDANTRKIVTTTTAGGNTYNVAQYSYDVLGRPECTALRMNSATWSSLPSSACSLGTTGSFGPDRITKTSYDAASRVTQVQTAYGTGDQANEATGTYNDNNTLAALTDAEGNKTSYVYDGFDRLSQTFYPNTTAGAGTSSSTDYEQLIYDANGNVTSRRLRGYASDSTQHIDFTYDALNRPTFKNLPGSEADVTFAYDNLGRLTSATDATGNYVTLGYDALGRKVSETTPRGTMQTGYDLANRRILLAWPDAFYVTYDHLVTGEVTAIRENGATSGIGVLASYSYDDLGRRTGLTRGNGVATSYGYDGASQLATMSADFAGTTYDQSLGFTRNPAGQIASTTRSNDLFAYNASANTNTATTVNGLNQATGVGAGAVTYDARGNLASTGSNSYTYSAENHLLTGPVATFTYDPLGRLSHLIASGVDRYFVYDGDMMAGETFSGTLSVRSVFGPGTDEPLVQYAINGSTVSRGWPTADERGSIVATSDDSGTVTSTNRYDEYGAPANNYANRFQYTGQAWIKELGIYYYKNRFYSPRLGRFMQTDPIGYGDGPNWYNYAAGDPINFNDPDGTVHDCGSGQHWENNPTGSHIPQCVSDGGGLAGGLSPGTPLSFGGGGGGFLQYVPGSSGSTTGGANGSDVVVTVGSPGYYVMSPGFTSGGYYSGQPSPFSLMPPDVVVVARAKAEPTPMGNVGAIPAWQLEMFSQRMCMAAIGQGAIGNVLGVDTGVGAGAAVSYELGKEFSKGFGGWVLGRGLNAAGRSGPGVLIAVIVAGSLGAYRAYQKDFRCVYR